MNCDNSLARSLGKIPLFQGMNDNELKTVLGLCQSMTFTADQAIFNEDDPSHSLYILLTGSVDINTRKNGKLHTLGSCDIFGEIGLITQRTRSASAIARSNCKLVRIDHVDFNLLAGKQPRISAILHRNISTNLANHVLRMNNSTVLEHIPPNQGEPFMSPRNTVVIGSI